MSIITKMFWILVDNLKALPEVSFLWIVAGSSVALVVAYILTMFGLGLLKWGRLVSPRLVWGSYTLVAYTVRWFYRKWFTRADGNNRALVTVDGRSVLNVELAPKKAHTITRPDGIGVRSWEIVQDVAAECRAQLGLDRSSEPSDLATRALIKKSVWGILRDPKREEFKDLRITDATKLCPYIAELALTPNQYEIEALELCSGDAIASNRSLARGAWGTHPVGFWPTVAWCFGLWTGEQYLPPVHGPAF